MFDEFADVAMEAGDELFAYASEIASLFSGNDVASTAADSWDFAANAAEKAAPVATGASNTSGLLGSFKKLFSWDDGDTKANAAKIAVLGGAVSGLGAGYFNNQKVKAETELMERKIGLEEKRDALKAANQNFSGMTFKPPEKGLLFNPALYQKRKPA